MRDCELGRLTAGDMRSVSEIVDHYIVHTSINFRTEPQAPEAWADDLREHAERYPWIGAWREDELLGLAYAKPFSSRRAYDWSVEVTVYVRHDRLGAGLGAQLYDELTALLDLQGYQTAVALITLPNARSVRVHERFGFRAAGVLTRVGYKLGRWHDVGLYQRVRASGDAAPATPRTVADVWALRHPA